MSLTGRIVQEIALQVKGLDDAKKLDQQISDLEKKKAKVTVDADTTAAKARLDAIDKEIASLNNERAKVEVDADTASADRKLDKIDTQVKDLENDRATVDVDADTASADRKLDDIDREIRALKNERAIVEVDADTSDADRDLKDIDRQLDKLRSQTTHVKVDADTTGATGALGGLKGAATGAFSFMTSAAGGFATAAAAAVAGFVGNAITDFQDLALGAGRLRDALGLTAESASRWVEVAGDIGISAQGVETAFGKILLAIGKAPKGGVFEQLAVRSKDGALDVNETILSVIDHLNAIEDPAKRATEAQKLLGKGWKDAAELIEAGSDQVRESLASVNDAQIVSDEQIAESRAMRDAFDDLGDQVVIFSNTVGSSLIPTMTTAAGALNSLVGPVLAVKGAIDSIGDIPIAGPALKFFGFMGGGPVLTAIKQIGVFGDIWSSVFGDDVPKATEGAVTSQEDLAKMEKKHSEATKENIARQKDWIAVIKGSGDALPGHAKLLAGAEAKLVDLEKALRASETGMTDNAVASSEFGAGMHDLAVKEEEAALAAKAFNDTIASTDFAATGIEGATAGMSAFHDQFFSLADIAANTEAAFDGLGKSLEANGKSFDLNTEAGRNNQKAIEDLSSAMDTQLAAAFDDSAGSFAEFDAKAKTIANTLRDRLINELHLSGDQADDMIRRLGLMPGDIETRYKLSGTEEAKLQLELLQGTIDRLPKNVQAVIDYKILMGDYVGAVQTAQNYANRHPVTIPVELRISTANLPAGAAQNLHFGANGTNSMPEPGGVAGEAGGEFVQLPNGRWGYVNRATYVPPKTKVISVRRTRSILRGRSEGPTGPGLSSYATGTGGTAVPSATLIINHSTNVNAAVVGNRYDVAKAVGQGNRDLARLLGRRGAGVR